MHQQAAAADGLAEAGDSCDHIQQQGRTKALSFMALVHPQAGQQGDGLGVAAGATAQSLAQSGDCQAPGVEGTDVGIINFVKEKT